MNDIELYDGYPSVKIILDLMDKMIVDIDNFTQRIKNVPLSTELSQNNEKDVRLHQLAIEYKKLVEFKDD